MIGARYHLATSVQRFIARLGCGDFFRHRCAEQTIDPGDNRRHRPEVGIKSHRASVGGAECVTRFEEQLDVGTTEPIDRLLRVTDKEEPSAFDDVILPTAGGLVRSELRR